MGPAFAELRHAAAEVVELDLPRERERALALVRASDVVVENFGPGVMERLGLGADACLAAAAAADARGEREGRRPLVYLSLPAAAPGDAAEAAALAPAAREAAILARAGVFTDMGLNRTLLGVEASYTHLPLASVYGAVVGAAAALAAAHGGRGGAVVAPLAAALSEMMVHNSLRFPRDRRYMNARARALADGAYPVAGPAALRALVDPFFSLYACADGRPYYLVCPAHARHQRRALRALGVEAAAAAHLAEDDPYSPVAAAGGLGSGSLGEAQAAALRPLLEAAFATRPAREWEDLLGAAGVPGAAVRSADEWRAEPHVRDAGLLDADGHLCNVGWLEAPPSAALSAPLSAPPSAPLSAPPSAPLSAPPSARATAAAVWPPRDGPPTPTPSAPPLPLAGVRVVDLCNVIAGPTIGAVLARFGADVLKVDPPTPTYAPDVAVVYGLACNVGKRSVLLDVADPHGRAALLALLADADVLLVNCTEACLARLRLAPADLRAALGRDDLVLARFDAWGGPAGGGRLAPYVGYDDCVQAGTGIMERFGGGLATAEEHAHIGTIDVVAGWAGAAACLAALLARRRRGRPAPVARASLASVGAYLQLPFLAGAPRAFRAGRGLACRGEHALLRCYRARDGWFLLAAALAPDDAAREAALAAAVAGDEGDDRDECRDARLHEASFAHLPVAEACRRARAAAPGAVVAVPLRGLDAVRAAHLRAAPAAADLRPDGAPTFQFLHQRDHPVGGSLLVVAPHAVRAAPPLTRADAPPAPRYGAHTRAVVGALPGGRALLQLGIAAEGWGAGGGYIPAAAPCDACGLRGRTRFVLPACDHVACALCLAGPACPRCGAPHGLADVGADARRAEWRERYGRWRRGAARGARGEAGAATHASPRRPPRRGAARHRRTASA